MITLLAQRNTMAIVYILYSGKSLKGFIFENFENNKHFQNTFQNFQVAITAMYIYTTTRMF